MSRDMSKVIFQTEWERFAGYIRAGGAPELQVTEMRKAFYAGATVLLCVLRDLEDAPISDAAASLVLQRICEEIQEYGRSLAAANLS